MNQEESANQQLVVVDDAEPVRTAFMNYAALLGWRVFASSGAEQPAGLDDQAPILVLLDLSLGQNSPERWLTGFRKNHPQAMVYLLTGLDENAPEIAAFRARSDIAGVLRKPLQLSRLPGLAKIGELQPEAGTATPTASTPPACTTCSASLLEQAVAFIHPIIRLLDPKTLACVYHSREAPWDPSDRMMQRMARHLAEHSDEVRVDRTDWDVAKQKFQRRRLYRAGPWYWLAEDWREQAEDSEFMRLALPQDWDAQLNALFMIFRQHWDITRLRFYRLAPLAGGTPRQPDYLIRPLWQHGGGFQDANDVPTDNEEIWKRNEYRLRESPHTQRVFADATQPWAVSEVPVPCSTSAMACHSVAWGNATHTACIPLRDARGNPVAMLALDRRSDHLAAEYAQDQIPRTDLSEANMRAMQGYLNALRPFLLDILAKRLEHLRTEWNQKLNQMQGEAMAEAEAQPALCRLFQAVLAQWSPSGSLGDMLLLQPRMQGLWAIWAGAGPRWENLSRGRLYDTADFLEPLRGLPDPFHVWHDLHETWKLLDADERKELAPLLGRDGTPPQGSLLALPLSGNGQMEGVMLAFASTKHFFTVPRADSLVQLAHSALGLLRWGAAEGQREWLTRALAHEFGEPMVLARNTLAQLPAAQARHGLAALRNLEAVIANLRFLGRADLAVEISVEAVSLLDVLGEARASLDGLYPARIAALPENDVQVHASRPALFQVLYNLLDNACKYGSGEPGSVRVEVQAANGEAPAVVRVINQADSFIDAAEAERIWLPYVRGASAPVAKGTGIGLAVVRQIARAVGMECTLEHPGSADRPLISFALALPRAPHPSEEKTP